MHELSMKDLFPACVTVLQERLIPIHYEELTRLALERLGVPVSAVLLNKEKENVREKLLLAERRGTAYTHAPGYYGVMQHWFADDHQFELGFHPPIVIPGNAEAGKVGAFECLMRAPYMVVHNPSLENTSRLNRIRSSGLVLEQHVAMWFASQYPEFFRPPDNAGQWRKPCGHDFKLQVLGHTFRVDVFGANADGSIGKRGRKKTTDLHLECAIAGQNCEFRGVIRGKNYRNDIDPATIFSPVAFQVWLNCARHGIPYSAAEPSGRVAA